MDKKNMGLYPKYYVEKLTHKGDRVEAEPVDDWVFVLNPKTDPGARFALLAYTVWAERNGYDQLGHELRNKLAEVKDED